MEVIPRILWNFGDVCLSSPNLLTAAIVLWNTVYLGRVIKALEESGNPVDPALLQYLSPLGWEHINLTGDYIWQSNISKTGKGEFRLLRQSA